MSTTTTTRQPAALAMQDHLVGVCRPTWPARWTAGNAWRLAHAVESHRSSEELAGEPELAVCGAVVAVTTSWWPAAHQAPGSEDDARVSCTVCLDAVGSC